MPKAPNSQMSLDLPKPSPSRGKAIRGVASIEEPPKALVLSLEQKRSERTAEETRRHFTAILELVRHLK
jgi:hypothetical protein